MKILYYFLGLPPLHNGGLMIYARDLALEAKKLGHEVFLLMPGYYNFLSHRTYVKKIRDHLNLPTFAIINPLPFSTTGFKDPEHFFKSIHYHNFEEFLEEISPDIIHVHSLIALPKEFLYAAKRKGIKIVYTTHDYYGLCPKVRLFDINSRPCEEYNNGNNCVLCNFNSPTIARLEILRNLNWIRATNKNISSLVEIYRKVKKRVKNSQKSHCIEKPDDMSREYHQHHFRAHYFKKMREYYLEMLSIFDVIHFNSTVSEMIFKKFVDVRGVVINLTHRRIIDNRRRTYLPIKDSYLNIGFLGNTSDRAKGFYLLLEAVEHLVEERNLKLKLHIWGYSSDDFQKDYVIYHGKYDHHDMENIFLNLDLLVFPSVCWETYGFVALEALSYGVPCLISERTGITDVVKLINKNMIITPSSKAISDAIYNLYKNPETLIKYHEDILRVSWIKEMKTHTLEIIEKFYK